MPVLSVDLAFRRWCNLGLVVLDRRPPEEPASTSLPLLAAGGGPARNLSSIHCEIVLWNDAGPVDANILAGRLNHRCVTRGIRVLMLDGPQAWKSRTNGLKHARVSERQLNTAAKTGLPGMVKPITYRAFAEFCVDVYDALCRRGWRRFESSEQPVPGAGRVLVESYPHAAWKSLGIKPLPSRRRARVSDLADAFGALRELMPITISRPPNHDQLQAIVGGLPGLALAENNAAGAQIFGKPPHREDGQWREGFIVLPVMPGHVAGLRWVN